VSVNKFLLKFESEPVGLQ